MTTIYTDRDADPSALEGCSLAVVGYGNQGRSWALNLRDSGLDPQVCVRADASREQAEQDGFRAAEIEQASEADVVCVLVPDDVIPALPLTRPETGLTIVASGYTLAFERFRPAGDLGMVAPRMLGPEVRRCYQEGAGFITAIGVEHDATGRALARTLAVAQAIGGLREGGIALSPMQEAVLDLGVEQVLSPALTHVNAAFVGVMLEQGIPLEAILTELFLSGRGRWSAPTGCCARRASRASSSTTRPPASTDSSPAAAPTTPSTSRRSCVSSPRRSGAGASRTSGTPSRGPAIHASRS
jgi:ketol-acid reductoisomerase